MTVTKGALGRGYVVASGAALSLALLGSAFVAVDANPGVAAVAAVGLIPAVGLGAAYVWLRRSDLEGHQAWTVAQWTGLGIGVATTAALGLLALGPPGDGLASALLAAGVAVGGGVGLLVGAVLVSRRRARRLSQSNDVLHRILRHNVRNDMNVVLGHLGEIDRGAAGPDAERVARMRSKIDDVLETVEKARHVDLALSAENRARRPVDLVPWIRETVDAVAADREDVRVETDLPERAWIRGDWLIGTALENLIENALGEGGERPGESGRPSGGRGVDRAAGTDAAQTEPATRNVRIAVRRVGETVRLRLADDGPPIPDNERVAFSAEGEEPLRHGTGVGLWLVRWIVESYGGAVELERADRGGNAIVASLPAAGDPERRSLPDRVRALARRRSRGKGSDAAATVRRR